MSAVIPGRAGKRARRRGKPACMQDGAHGARWTARKVHGARRSAPTCAAAGEPGPALPGKGEAGVARRGEVSTRAKGFSRLSRAADAGGFEPFPIPSSVQPCARAPLRLCVVSPNRTSVRRQRPNFLLRLLLPDPLRKRSWRCTTIGRRTWEYVSNERGPVVVRRRCLLRQRCCRPIAVTASESVATTTSGCLRLLRSRCCAGAVASVCRRCENLGLRCRADRASTARGFSCTSVWFG